MTVMTTGTAPKALWPGVKAWWGRKYNEHTLEYDQLYEMDTSNQMYEEDVQITGFGYGSTKAEGESVNYVAEAQGYVSRYTHVNYALGYICTEEEIDDNLYLEVGKRRGAALAFSMRQTIERIAANPYNRAFNPSYTYGDNKEICATDHPDETGTFSNELAIAADMSEASLEDLCIQIGTAENHKGLKVALLPEALIIPVALQYEAQRILESVLQNDTSNNALNAMRSMGVIPKIVVNHYLTDTDAFFIRTNCPRGMVGYKRKEKPLMVDGDFDTSNVKHKQSWRGSFGCTDPRGLFGSPGA